MRLGASVVTWPIGSWHGAQVSHNSCGGPWMRSRAFALARGPRYDVIWLDASSSPSKVNHQMTKSMCSSDYYNYPMKYMPPLEVPAVQGYPLKNYNNNVPFKAIQSAATEGRRGLTFRSVYCQ